MVLFHKLFKGYNFCFLGDSVGRCVFEQFAHETNLKKKRSVGMCYSHFGNEVCNGAISIRQRGFISDWKWRKILVMAMGFVDHLGPSPTKS